MLAAKLQEEGTTSGYEWCVQELRQCGFVEVSHKVLLSKADALMTYGKYDQAIQIYEV